MHVNETRPIVQICFSLKNNADMSDIRNRMLGAKERLDAHFGPGGYLVKSCHLNRDICADKGFGTDVPDIFDDVFGAGNYECELTEKTFAEAMANMRIHREQLAMKAEKLVILSETPLTNVDLEIELFTESRVMIV